MAKSQNENAQLMSVLNHISGIFVGFLGPLIFYLVAENKDVKEHAKKALNWQLSVLIYFIIAGVLMIILIGFLLFPILYVLNVVFSIIAAIKASENKVWDYPLTIPFLK